MKKALIGKVLGGDGRGTTEGLFRALKWALDEADVVSLSLGFDVPGYVAYLVTQKKIPIEKAVSVALVDFTSNLRMFDAIMAENRALDSGFPSGGGAVVIAAAGNESEAPRYRIGSSLPAVAEGIISVGALQREGSDYAVAPFSNSMVDVCAPGVEILSARAGGGLVPLSGTSMAAPHAAGVAALWWQALRGTVPASSQYVIGQMTAKAERGGIVGADLAERGAGLVQAPR